MPTSSTVWCGPVARSPRAVTVMSNCPCFANSSSTWSKKPIPVSTRAWPRPSRSMLTSTSVSDVRLSTWAFRDPPKLLWERSAGTISPSLSWEYQSPQTDAKQNTTVPGSHLPSHNDSCLLYTSDAADDLLCVDLGGRRIIKKKTKTNKHKHTTHP